MRISYCLAVTNKKEIAGADGRQSNTVLLGAFKDQAKKVLLFLHGEVFFYLTSPLMGDPIPHKNQYKSEHTNRRAKSAYNLEPIYLQTPERIQAMLFLFKTALQVIVLIERAARKNIDNRDKGLDNFMPNRKDVRNPKTEYLLAEFQDIVKGEMVLPDGKAYGFVSELTELQKDILSLLEVPNHAYSYEYLFDTR